MIPALWSRSSATASGGWWITSTASGSPERGATRPASSRGNSSSRFRESAVVNRASVVGRRRSFHALMQRLHLGEGERAVVDPHLVDVAAEQLGGVVDGADAHVGGGPGVGGHGGAVGQRAVEI